MTKTPPFALLRFTIAFGVTGRARSPGGARARR
jgi:hypothetical protein